jgi:hypothetical protein
VQAALASSKEDEERAKWCMLASQLKSGYSTTPPSPLPADTVSCISNGMGQSPLTQQTQHTAQHATQPSATALLPPHLSLLQGNGTAATSYPSYSPPGCMMPVGGLPFHSKASLQGSFTATPHAGSGLATQELQVCVCACVIVCVCPFVALFWVHHFNVAICKRASIRLAPSCPGGEIHPISFFYRATFRQCFTTQHCPKQL